MTYIELFDKSAIENVCSCLVTTPERVILVGNSRKELEAHAKRYTELFRLKGAEIEFLPRSVNRNNVAEIVRVLGELVETYPDCIIDLTGGDDLYLVAVGVILEKYKEKGVQAHRYNIRNGVFYDCDQDGKCLCESKAPALSVSENICLYGGSFMGTENSCESWDMTDDFKKDIDLMWKICASDPKGWNIQTALLCIMENLGEKDESNLSITVSVKKFNNHLKQMGHKKGFDGDFAKELHKNGLFSYCCFDENEIYFEYKNEQVKRCLLKSGQALELKIYKLALELKDENESPYYNDVKTGICIDWDEKDDELIYNEVDVALMKGLVPVFVSCKNGTFDSEELYKLKSVGDKFGGKYGKKIIVTTCNESAKNLRPRAVELGITIIDGVQGMDDIALCKKIKSFS